MDDRIRREDSQKGSDINLNSPGEPKTEKGSIVEDITSNAPVESINPTTQKVKRFEVHIPDSASFDIPETTGPARVPAPPRRPAPVAPGPKAVRRPAQKPIQPGARPTGPVRRPAAPGSLEPGKKPPVAPAKPENTKKAKAEKVKKEKKKKAVAKKEKAASKKNKRGANFAYRFAKGLLITCFCVIFVVTLTTVVSSVAFAFINDILVIDDEDKGYSVVVEIPEGATYDTVFEILKDNGLVSQPLLTDFFCRFRHYDYESVYDEETGDLVYDEATGEVKKQPVEYEAGVYYLYADSGIENILDSMLAYNDVNKDTVRLTFPEGFTIAEVFEKIEKYEVCAADKLYANLEVAASQYDFISEITDSEGRYLKAEGYLFPDTYDFFIGESASSVLEKLFANFEAKWEKGYDAQLKKLGMTKDQIITIASIIQCEAKDGTQMADISSVIHNRLKNSASYPTLDMDSTSDYINSLKSYNVLTEVHYNLYLESYNTYSKTGLPPGPICNPGASAIRAALYPSDTTYYFFCHSENGDAYYASTATEHENNVQKVVYGNDVAGGTQ